MLDRVIAYGRTDDANEEIKVAADKICRAGIHEMLKLETPNLHEIMLDRVIAYGHTWSPLHELVPDPPLRHGHAISIEKATQAILKPRDGKLRAAVPVSPMGKCVFLNDVEHEEMAAALEVHKRIVKEYPRAGEGIEAYVDGSDTGYNAQGRPVEEIMASNGFAKTNGSVKNGTNATVQQIKELMGGCEHSHVPEPVAVTNGSVKNGTNATA